jgi:tetratricopeptide (TPR) repeat protein
MGALYEASIALVDAGEYKQALPYFQEAERLADQMRAVNEQVFALARQAQCWLRLDRWDEVLSTEEKLQAVKQRYPEFAERARTWCFYAALKAGVHALRGEFDLAATWREEATAIMVAINGPPEQWTRSQHY